MVAAKYDVMPESVTAECEAKPEFNAQSFDVLIHKINNDPDLLGRDWRELVRSEFRLSAEQERSLVDVPENRVKEIQAGLAAFTEQIRRGATIQGRIVKRPIEEQTPEAVHGVQIELQLPEPTLQTSHVLRMLRIAHCDANCRNWKWNSF